MLEAPFHTKTSALCLVGTAYNRFFLSIRSLQAKGLACVSNMAQHARVIISCQWTGSPHTKSGQKSCYNRPMVTT